MDLLKTNSKETRIMKTDKEEAAGSGGIMDEVRERLDELRELLEENYITESEYAAARANVLMEVGVDIAVHSRNESKRMYRLEARSRRAGAGRDYRRFALPALLIAVVLACAVFFYWRLEKGGLFSPLRNVLPSSFLSLLSVTSGEPIASGKPVLPAIPYAEDLAEDLAEEPGDAEGEVFSAVSGDLGPEVSEPATLELTALELTALEDSADAVWPEAPVSEDRAALLGWAVVSARRVRVRAAPDTTAANVLGWAVKGERFAVLKEAPGRDGSKWYNVRYEKIGGEGGTGGGTEDWLEGWIKASMTKFEEER
jgi:hypothetical protein